MRTTLTIDDKLAAELKKRAYESGKPFKQVVNETIRAGLTQDQAVPNRKPYRVEPVSMGQAIEGLDLNQATRLAGEMEDDELARKMEMRK